MPLYNSITYTSSGTKTSINLDPSIVPFNATIQCSLLGGAVASYKLQWSLDPLNSPTATDSDANWVDSTDIPDGTAASAYSQLSFPVARVRLVIAALSGGSLQLQISQGLSTN